MTVLWGVPKALQALRSGVSEKCPESAAGVLDKCPEHSGDTTRDIFLGFSGGWGPKG